MSRSVKIMLTIPTAIICFDILLMIINGTIIMVIGTLLGFYLIASLTFKESAYYAVKRWINTGRFVTRGGAIHDRNRLR